MSEKRINWGEVANIAMKEAENYYEKQGDAMTLRGLFYVLVSKNVIPNTKTAYKTLSETLAKLRYAGKFPPHLLKDVTRVSDYLEQSEYYAKELSEEELKKEIDHLIDRLSKYSINPWSDQKHRVLIALEKEALFDITKSWIKDLTVDGIEIGIYQLKCLKGFDSATDIITLARILKALTKDGYTPVVLIISDFDPSGEEIVRDFQNRLSSLSGVKFISEKILVTFDQIRKFNLPSAPETAEEVEKLRRDPRYKKFVEQYGLVRVESDAMFSIIPEATKEIIHQAILKYFDMNIFNEKTKKRMEEARSKSDEAKKKMKERIEKMLKG